jgi:excisionase family DNA binding protein
MEHETVSDGAAGRLLRPTEAAARLGVAVSRVYGWARDGILPSVRLGRSVRIPEQGLVAFVDSLVDLSELCDDCRRQARAPQDPLPDVGNHRPIPPGPRDVDAHVDLRFDDPFSPEL